MKRVSVKTVITLLIILQFPVIMYSQTTADSIAIQNILNEETLAWNNGDAQAYSKYFSADGTFTNILGGFFIGHIDFQARHDQVFKGPFRGTTLKQDNVSLRFLKADVAITETLSSVSGFSKDGRPKGQSWMRRVVSEPACYR